MNNSSRLMVFSNASFIRLVAGLALALPLQSQIVTTVAGNSTWGQVWHNVMDAGGNFYAADYTHHMVYKITPTGITTTVVGTGTAGYSGDGGQAVNATLHSPTDVAVGPDGTLYIADYLNECIRKVAPNGVITTFAGSCTKAGFMGDGKAATAALMNQPFMMLLDAKGDLYVSDYLNRRIREITTDGNINTIAGSGSGPSATAADGSLATSTDMLPGWIALGSDGSLYYTDDGFEGVGLPRVRKINPTTNTVSTVAGNGTRAYSGDGGPATSAQLNSATGVVVDSAGDIYIADYSGCEIRKIAPSGTISTYAGNGNGSCGYSGDGGAALMAQFNGPTGPSVDAQYNLYVCDVNNHKVRKVSSVPEILMTGVVNGASFVSGALAPGEIATVFGTNLTFDAGINLASSLPLATSLINVQVMVNGTAAPIIAVDNVNGQEQINFQAPFEIAGLSSATVQVIDNGAAGNTVTVPVAVAQPGIFTYTVGNTTYGAILHSANYATANTASPATAGETVLIYCTGLGTVSPQPADGMAAAGSSATNAAATVTIDGVQAEISYSGLAPGFVGLYQINAVVPSGLTAGNQPVIITVNGTQSSITLLPIM